MFVVKLMAEGRTSQASVFRCFPRQSSTTFSMTLPGAMNSHIQAKRVCPARESNPRPSYSHRIYINVRTKTSDTKMNNDGKLGWSFWTSWIIPSNWKGGAGGCLKTIVHRTNIKLSSEQWMNAMSLSTYNYFSSEWIHCVGRILSNYVRIWPEHWHTFHF